MFLNFINFISIDWRSFAKKNIIVVDWSKFAMYDYFRSYQANVLLTAQIIYQMICSLMEELGLSTNEEHKSFLNSIEIAGHSLGAHVAGRVGYLFRLNLPMENNGYGIFIGVIYGKPLYEFHTNNKLIKTV